ncbi:MAG: hypothetical protein Kow00109_07880 [Acidobacteriota bacterium]
MLLLSLPLSLRALVFSKFSLQLTAALCTYLILYFLGGLSISYLHSTDVLLPLPILLYILASIIVLMTFLIACTFLFNPTLSYLIVMLAGLAAVTAASLSYHAGWFRMGGGQLQQVAAFLQDPVWGAGSLLVASLVAVATAWSTWKLLARRDPVELAR